MTNYMKWLVRSRAMAFAGAALVLGASFAGFELGLDERIVSVIIPPGVCLLVAGMLDSLGLIQRKWVKAAIREENQRMRSGG
ncbi:hypothetical protein [Massilia sp. UBA6681]|jgi:hypothetical protein|uniref:hypothetical protein n=1 Tax=Massilia sp. UBA6681 TaxID=1946839 RepID=UPI0025BA6D8B|nr:hypothetical protein [Massilia sp. UBA6681]